MPAKSNKSKARNGIFSSKVTYSAKALRDAKAAGVKAGDTGAFDSWYRRQKLDASSSYKRELQQAFREGVESPSQSKSSGGARKGGTRYKGVVISRDAEGNYRVSSDPDSEFESLTEAKRFVSASRNPKKKNKESVVKSSVSGTIGIAAGLPDALIDIAAGAESFLEGAASAVFKAAESLAKRNPRKYKRNPESGAIEMYEKFHGRPPREILEFKETYHIHEWLAGLGTLVDLKVNTITGKEVELESDPETLLATNEEGSQLYIVGGDQTLDLKGMGFNKNQCTKDMVLVGFIYELTYRTEKDFENFETVDFYHELSEDSGDPLPSLVYDVKSQHMMISGGSYHINKPLVGTSPGIED